MIEAPFHDTESIDRWAARRAVLVEMATLTYFDALHQNDVCRCLDAVDELGELGVPR